MRASRPCLLVAVSLAACRFSVGGVDLSGGGRDLAGPVDLGGGGDLAPASDMACGSVPNCPFGCAQLPTPHCRQLQPSGVVTVGDYTAPGLTKQAATGDVSFNTDTGAITGGLTRAAGSGVSGGIGFRAAMQSGGPAVGVFSVAGFTLPANAKMTFTGGAAFALVSSGNVSIAGTVDGSCSNGVVGPGGSAGGVTGVDGGKGRGLGGGGGGGMAAMGASGGGGGGYGDVGGTGAQGFGTTVTPNGVIWAFIQSSGTLLLVGGSGGGAGGGVNGPAGGGGGGAIQLSVNGTLDVSGTLDVGGCGGARPNAMTGGGGGGSGGALVLEAANISIATSAILSSNGGGGAGGDTGSAGGDGMPGSTAAPGGAAGDISGGGGSGGARGSTAGVHNTEGTNAPHLDAINYGGGGGGGTGRILFRSLTLSDQATVVSPDPADINRMNLKMTTYDLATFL